MAADTSWQSLLDDISTKLRKSKGFIRFAKLKTNEEKIEFCLRDEYIKIKILKWLRVVGSSRHRKHWEKSAELRIEGNACFQRKEYERALELYTRSILAAPYDSQHQMRSGDELALAFGNRSAALFFLDKYTHCLEDIERAIENGYPKDLCYKLYFRKAQCLSKTGPRSAALKALDKTLLHIRNAKIEPKKLEKYVRESEELKATLTEFAEDKEVNPSNSEENVPRLAYGCQSALAFASSCIETKYSEAKGRYLITNRPIKAGDTLIVEKPYTSVLLPNHYATHCHHCYLKLDAPIPCHHCTQVRFCSIHCVDESWRRYHKWECGYLDTLHSVGIAHLGFRLLVVTGLQNLIDFYGRSLEPANHHENYDNSYYNVFHLITHANLLHIEDSFQYAMTATLILLLLERIGFVTSNNRDDGEDPLKDSIVHSLRQMELSPLTPKKSYSHASGSSSLAKSYDSNLVPHLRPESLRLYLGSLILRHIHQLVCNAHAITALIKFGSGSGSNGVVTQKQVRIATAIYPTASLMNHSCDPTIITSFHKDILIVKSVKSVPPNGEIFNCYGPHFKRMSKEERQKALKEQYGFICDCEACRSEEEREQRFQGLKCMACSGPLRPPDGNNRSSCMECDAEQECTTQLQKAFGAHDLFVQGLQLAARGNFKDALEKLRRCLKMREKVMYKLHRQLAEVQDQIARCYASLGEYCLAVEYLRPTLEATEATYGENSVELANELQKFTDLLLNAILQLAKEGYSLKSSTEVRELIKEAMDVIERAEKIFMLHYGSSHESVQELRSKRDEITKLTKPKNN